MPAPAATISVATVERVAKALCANDYVNGPALWEPESIDVRWAEQDPERVQYYTTMAHAALRAMDLA